MGFGVKETGSLSSNIVWGLHLHEELKKGGEIPKEREAVLYETGFTLRFSVLMQKMKAQELRGDSKGPRGHSAAFKCKRFFLTSAKC